MTITPATTKVITGKVRLSYVNLLTPRADDNGEAKYSALLLIPKTDKVTVSKIKGAAEAALAAGIAAGKLKAGTSLKSAWQTLKDGDDREDLAERPEYQGNYYMNVSARNKPGIVDADMQEVIEPNQVYSGTFAKVSMNAYAYNVGSNKGITFGLNNVQVLGGGDYLGGRVSAEAEDWGDDSDVL